MRTLQLRHNFTAYDAIYIALAEALAVPLITCDSACTRLDFTAPRWKFSLREKNGPDP